MRDRFLPAALLGLIAAGSAACAESDESLESAASAEPIAGRFFSRVQDCELAEFTIQSTGDDWRRVYRWNDGELYENDLDCGFSDDAIACAKHDNYDGGWSNHLSRLDRQADGTWTYSMRGVGQPALSGEFYDRFYEWTDLIESDAPTALPSDCSTD